MENKEISYKGKWYKVGDIIRIKIFWCLPFIKKEYTITSIGNDCSATITRNNNNRTIKGSVKRYTKK